MKSFRQFLEESINVSGDFNGNVYYGSSSPEAQQPVGEEYTADVFWNGNLYRLDLVSKSGVPSRQSLAEQLQDEYPGAVVHQIYPAMDKNQNIVNRKRYHPSKLEWID
jgi:hypothetical protein